MKTLLQRIAECTSCARRRKLMREYAAQMGKAAVRVVRTVRRTTPRKQP